MRKGFFRIVSIMLCLLLMPWGQVLAEAAPEGDLAWLMGLYGFTLPEAYAKALQTQLSQTFDCGDVQITLTEVLYDGQWLYTAATAVPTQPDKAIILPGSAELEDLMAGGYGEGLRDDSRSFQDAALADGKELISVFLYPSEFDDAPYFFLDHRQDAGDQSTLFSGAPVMWQEEERTIHLTAQLTHIFLSCDSEPRSETFTFPVDIRRVGAVDSKLYRAAPEDGLPFEALQLVQTPLTTYAIPQWKTPDVEGSEFALLDPAQTPYDRGAPPDTTTFDLPSLPDTIAVAFQPYDEDAPKTIVVFSAVENP